MVQATVKDVYRSSFSIVMKRCGITHVALTSQSLKQQYFAEGLAAVEGQE